MTFFPLQWYNVDGSILFTAAFQYGNANVVLILQKLQPLFAVLLAAWILKERVNKGLLS